MALTNRALFAIERNLNRDLSLGEIAKACGISRFHLAHAFGEATGPSVMYVLASAASDIPGVTCAPDNAPVPYV